MTDLPPPADKPASPRNPSGLEGVVDDMFGVDFKILRTLRDLVIRPGRVADAAIVNDHSRYTRPFRVYLALFAVMTVAFGWAGLSETNTLSAVFAEQPAAMARVEAQLAAAGSSIAEADAVSMKWSGWANWPVSAIASLVFVLAIWGARPKLGLFKSFMLYLVISNASNMIALPVILAGVIFGTSALIASGAVAMVSFFVYGALVLHRRAADTALGLILRTAALVAAAIPMTVAVVALFFVMLEIAFRMEIGVSRIELLIPTAAPPPSAAGTP